MAAARRGVLPEPSLAVDLSCRKPLYFYGLPVLPAPVRDAPQPGSQRMRRSRTTRSMKVPFWLGKCKRTMSLGLSAAICETQPLEALPCTRSSAPGESSIASHPAT